MTTLRLIELVAAITLGLVGSLSPGLAQLPAVSRSQPLIPGPINESNLVALPGNTRPEARSPANDRGRVDDSLPLPHMLLQLQRPAAQEQALKTLIDQLHDPNSPNYHRWLSAAEIGAQFGPAASDIQAVTGWLSQHGFIVNTVYPNGMVIDYSGTAGQIREAFHTEIHNLEVNGVAHLANVSDPQIPKALAPAVVGIVSLHDFKPRSAAVHNPQIRPELTYGDNYWITPPDLATIYNFNPVFAAGITGQGQTIYLIENSDLYTVTDWSTFRSAFGIPLSSYPDASLSTIHPNCSDPGINVNDYEATLDAEYASAAAPSAAIVMVTCPSSNNTGGWFIAIENLLNGGSPPAIVNMSYGGCEEEIGAALNAAITSAYQTGVAAGTSIFVSAGDEGAGACDWSGPDNLLVSHGITVDGTASTPYNVAVGGTDFADTYLGQNSTYWNSTNTANYGSAKSYIPEIPWNSTCGSQLSATYNGYSTTYGSSGFCNSALGTTGHYLSSWAGSGGPSACATGSASVSEVDSGTCAGYAKPSWQSGVIGIPSDGVRDLPDVSLFASIGPWLHGYIVCFSDTSSGGYPCTTSPDTWLINRGGTSFAAPIWAGIQALINQSTGTKQGLPNYMLYKLAASEYGASGSSLCNSSNGNTVASSCIFYDVTLGDNDVACVSGSPNCYDPSGTYGVISTSTGSYAPAYKAQTGWDFATGIGTVNVANLVSAWSLNGGQATLSVSIFGTGTVTSNPSNISCPSTCSDAFAAGSQVTLTATPANGWTFSGWSGACTGTGNCTVIMSAGQSATATFAQITYELLVGVSGSGTVSSSPSGINCSNTCNAAFASGSQVTLNGTPGSGYSFLGWNGPCGVTGCGVPCGGTGSCVVTMNAIEGVSAYFIQTTYTLSVGVSGSGAVTSSPSGISCGSTCSTSFTSGTQVTLNETPGSGQVFTGWSGACSGTGSCVVTVNAAASVTAAFTQEALTRTFVSSSGVDLNPCTIAAPCATFARAYTLTQQNGIIAALNPGKYGPLTISYPITVNGNGWAAITGPAQGNGITINAGSGNVILTGLEVDGAGAAYNGIVFNSGSSLTVSNCIVKDFISGNSTSGNGIMIAPTSGAIDFTIVNTVALNNGSAGIHYLPASGSAAATGAIDHVIASNNAIGVAVDLSAASGGSAAVTISNSVANNNTSDGIVTASAAGTVTVTVDRDEINSNGTGVGVGANTTVLLSRSVIAKNLAYGISNSGTVGSSQDNRISGNGNNNAVQGGALASVAPQ